MSSPRYRIHAMGTSYAVVAYDRAGKPLQGHPLSMPVWPTRELAEAAISAYVSRDARRTPRAIDDER